MAKCSAFDTAVTEKGGGRRETRERSFGRLEAKAPSSLRKITQGGQDDDAHRIVREPREILWNADEAAGLQDYKGQGAYGQG